VHGKKNLSKVSVVGLSRALEHDKEQAEYFENLVFFNQAEDLKTKSMFFDRLCEARCWNSSQKKIMLLQKDQYEYFSNWHHSAVRSLIGLYPVRERDTEWISEHVYPRITMLDAQRSIKLLLRLGLVEKSRNGMLKLTAQHITTGSELLDVAALNFYRDTAELARNAIDHLPRHVRNVSGVTVGISRTAYDQIVEEINDFRTRIVNIAGKDIDSDRVYQVSVHFFPLSKTNIRKRTI
jgi:uncharacterized protein (TIGR02147 family)